MFKKIRLDNTQQNPTQLDKTQLNQNIPPIRSQTPQSLSPATAFAVKDANQMTALVLGAGSCGQLAALQMATCKIVTKWCDPHGEDKRNVAWASGYLRENFELGEFETHLDDLTKSLVGLLVKDGVTDTAMQNAISSAFYFTYNMLTINNLKDMLENADELTKFIKEKYLNTPNPLAAFLNEIKAKISDTEHPIHTITVPEKIGLTDHYHQHVQQIGTTVPATLFNEAVGDKVRAMDGVSFHKESLVPNFNSDTKRYEFTIDGKTHSPDLVYVAVGGGKKAEDQILTPLGFKTVALSPELPFMLINGNKHEPKYETKINQYDYYGYLSTPKTDKLYGIHPVLDTDMDDIKDLDGDTRQSKINETAKKYAEKLKYEGETLDNLESITPKTPIDIFYTQARMATSTAKLTGGQIVLLGGDAAGRASHTGNQGFNNATGPHQKAFAALLDGLEKGMDKQTLVDDYNTTVTESIWHWINKTHPFYFTSGVPSCVHTCSSSSHGDDCLKRPIQEHEKTVIDQTLLNSTQDLSAILEETKTKIYQGKIDTIQGIEQMKQVYKLVKVRSFMSQYNHLITTGLVSKEQLMQAFGQYYDDTVGTHTTKKVQDYIRNVLSADIKQKLVDCEYLCSSIDVNNALTTQKNVA